MRALVTVSVSVALVLTACAPAPTRLPLGAPRGTPTPTPRPLDARVTPPAAVLTRVVVATPDVAPTPVPALEPTPPPVRAPVAVAVDKPQAPTLDGVLDGLIPDGTPAYGLVLEDLGSGARTSVNASEEFPSASLYKLGLAWFALREVDAGNLDLDALVPIEDEDTVEPEPRGGFTTGDTPTVREALGAMLSVSSNAAAHAFLRVLGRENLNQEMQRIGLGRTRVPHEIDSEAVTSAADIARLLRLISTSSELSVTSKEVLARGMANVAPPDALRDTLPNGVDILDKTGNLTDSSNVGALLETPRGTAIVVVVDTGVNPGDARAVIAELGQIAYRNLLE